MYRRTVLFDCKGCNVQKKSDCVINSELFDCKGCNVKKSDYYLIVMVAMYTRKVILVLFDCKGCNVQKNSDFGII